MTGNGLRANTHLPWLGILTCWALLHAIIVAVAMERVFGGGLVGTDGYMRLVRVAELAGGEGWYDSTIARMNAPFGSVLHWTRPLDVLLLAVSAIARPFTASFDQALLFAGMVVSPLIAALVCVLMAWAVQPLLGRRAAFMAAVLVLLQPGIGGYTMAGRSDHHALLFLVVVLALGLTLRLLIKPPNSMADSRMAGFAGAVYAAGVWISVEMMLLAGLCIGALALRWIYDTAARPRVLLRSSGVFAIATGVALLIERAPRDLLAVEFDRISIVHVAIAAITFACWAGINAAYAANRTKPFLESVRGRFTMSAAAGALGGVVLVAIFPDFISGPFGQLDPRIIPIWHERVLELSPLIPSNKQALRDFLIFLGSTTPALLLLVYMALREPALENRAGWLMILLVTGVYYALSMKHLRFAPFAELAAVPALAELLRRLFKLCKEELSGIGEAAGKIFGALLLVLGGIFIGAAIPTDANTNTSANGDGPKKQCNIAEVAPVLNDPEGLGRSPKIIAGLMDYGPEILYRTRHAVLGAPYHRNGDGIWDGYWFLATTDAEESRAILARRKADYVLACDSKRETRFFTELSESGNLYTRIKQGNPPPWLVRLPYDPDAIGGFRIYRIVK